MSLFKRLRWSAQNGLILLNARGEVTVAGYKQTSARYAFIWQDAFRHIPAPPAGAKVLMLGLGGGGALPAVYEACPTAQVVAIEHDAKMIEIARELGHQGQRPFPRTVAGDARVEMQ